MLRLGANSLAMRVADLVYQFMFGAALSRERQHSYARFDTGNAASCLGCGDGYLGQLLCIRIGVDECPEGFKLKFSLHTVPLVSDFLLVNKGRAAAVVLVQQ